MAYVAQHVGADRDGKFNIFPFNDLIDDMLDFDPSNRTKYDLTMAFLVGITAVHHVIKIKTEEDKGKRGSGFNSLSDWI
jgi:hypothetical protein